MSSSNWSRKDPRGAGLENDASFSFGSLHESQMLPSLSGKGRASNLIVQPAPSLDGNCDPTLSQYVFPSLPGRGDKTSNLVVMLPRYSS